MFCGRENAAYPGRLTRRSNCIVSSHVREQTSDSPLSLRSAVNPICDGNRRAWRLRRSTRRSSVDDIRGRATASYGRQRRSNGSKVALAYPNAPPCRCLERRLRSVRGSSSATSLGRSPYLFRDLPSIITIHAIAFARDLRLVLSPQRKSLRRHFCVRSRLLPSSSISPSLASICSRQDRGRIQI